MAGLKGVAAAGLEVGSLVSEARGEVGSSLRIVVGVDGCDMSFTAGWLTRARDRRKGGDLLLSQYSSDSSRGRADESSGSE
jgi:hypothetical protein